MCPAVRCPNHPLQQSTTALSVCMWRWNAWIGATNSRTMKKKKRTSGARHRSEIAPNALKFSIYLNSSVSNSVIHLSTINVLSLLAIPVNHPVLGSFIHKVIHPRRASLSLPIEFDKKWVNIFSCVIVRNFVIFVKTQGLEHVTQISIHCNILTKIEILFIYLLIYVYKHI